METKEARYVLVGGGSGGHITPLVAVAEEIRKHQPSVHIAHIGHKGDPLNKVTRQSESINAVYEVSAGKFRRYHGDSYFARLFDWKSNLLNFRDFFRFVCSSDFSEFYICCRCL
jgi:UDP-N-acetylglucosamine:LPS N-acetylglucosamine transferase